MSERPVDVDSTLRSRPQREFRRPSTAALLARIDRGPAGVAPVLLVSSLVSSAAACAICLLVHPPGRITPGDRAASIVFGSAALLLGALVVVRASPSLRFGGWPWTAGPRSRHARTATVWALALSVWLPLCLIPVYLHARATKPASKDWIWFGGRDKEWVPTMFLLGTLGVAVLLVAATRIVDAHEWHPAGAGALSWPSVARPAIAFDAPRGETRALTSTRVLLFIVRIGAGVAIAFYFFGPPWHIAFDPTPIDSHEEVHMSGLQAISAGFAPYVRESSISYGPGMQLFTSWYMHHVSSFSVVGFREAVAVEQWLGVSILLAVVFLVFRPLIAAVIAFAATVLFPGLQFFGFVNHNPVYTGFWGWANPLRYVGTFTLALLFPLLARRRPGRMQTVLAVALGLWWGLEAYIGQENLSGGLIVVCVLTVLLALMGSVSLRVIARCLAGLVLGVVCFWIAPLAYYAALGDLTQFVSAYLHMPRSVAAGFGNTSYYGGFGAPYGHLYYVLPFVLALLLVLSVLRTRSLGVANAWTRGRTLLVGALVGAIALESGALLRADQPHLLATTIGLPVVFVAAAFELPQLFFRRKLLVVAAGVAIAAVPFLLMPHSQYSWSTVEGRLKAPYDDRRALAARPAPAAPASLAAERVGPGLWQAPVCCTSVNAPMSTFIALLNRIHAVVGDRPTAIANDFGGVLPTALYFLADLRPAPSVQEPWVMVITQRQYAEWYDYYQRHIANVGAVITDNLQEPVATIFLAAYPRARRVTLSWLGVPRYILLR
jgi:hypothetical protein